MVVLILSIQRIAHAECTDRPECWPEGSAMHTGLTLRQQQQHAEQSLQRQHETLLQRLGATLDADGQPYRDTRVENALQEQYSARLRYLKTECALVGALTGAGGSWPSTYAMACELKQTQQHQRQVRTALKCLDKIPAKERWLDQNRCLSPLIALPQR